jgi:uncharacterized protein (TIRG00374 family)
MSFTTKQKILLIFSFVLGLGIFLWFGKIVGWSEIGKALKVFTGWEGLVIVLLSFLVAFLGALRWKEILKDCGVKTSFVNLFKIYLGGYSMMYLFPILVWGGEIYRMYGLTSEKHVDWRKTTASVVIERILEWTINILFIFLGLAYFIYNVYLPPKELMIVFGIALLFFISILTFFYTKALGGESIVKIVVKKFFKKEISVDNGALIVEKEIYEFFNIHNNAFKKGVLLSILRSLAMQLRVWVLIWFLGQTIGFWSSLSILSFSYVSSLIPIPASLGSHEALQFFAFQSLGLSVSMATVFTLIIRAGEIIVSSVGMVFLIRSGFSLIGNKFLNNDKNK